MIRRISLFTFVGLILVFVITMTSASVSTSSQEEFLNKGLIFNFTDPEKFTEEDLNEWFESSDTVRQQGMSKATLTLQKLNKGNEQRAIFFALLNPQPNGAGFAGMKRWLNQTEFTPSPVDIENAGVSLSCRAQGLSHWKVILYHNNMEDVDPRVTFESFFDVNTTATEFTPVKLGIQSFKAYFRGRQVDDVKALDTNKIAGIGLQAYGGVYKADKQSGPGTLELEFIDIRI